MLSRNIIIIKFIYPNWSMFPCNIIIIMFPCIIIVLYTQSRVMNKYCLHFLRTRSTLGFAQSWSFIKELHHYCWAYTRVRHSTEAEYLPWGHSKSPLHAVKKSWTRILKLWLRYYIVCVRNHTTSDFSVNSLSWMLSGAIHFTGSLILLESWRK